MYTGQDIFNHSIKYFQDRIQNHNGYTNYGWSNPYTGDRCALGSMIGETRTNSASEVFLIFCHRILAQDCVMNALPAYCRDIYTFNDQHASYYDICSHKTITLTKLTDQEIQRFVDQMVAKYGFTNPLQPLPAPQQNYIETIAA